MNSYAEYRAIVGNRVELPCNITMPSNDDSITLILWYRGDTNGAPIYSLDARQEEVEQTKHHFVSDDLMNRAQLNITSGPALLTIDPVRGEDEGEYRCRVDFRWARTVNTIVNLVVIVPPRKLIIKDEKLQPISELAGPYDEDSDVKLTCEAKGARPPAVVHWYRDNTLIDDSYQIIQEGARVRNDLLLTTVNRNDLFAQLRCQAFNTNASLPLQTKLILDINLRPLNVEILANNQPLIAGRKVDIICQSMGSRPFAQIYWHKNKRKLSHSRENFEEDDNVTTSVSVITLTPVIDDNGLELVCSAENTHMSNNSTIQDIIVLNVLYEPLVSVVITSNHRKSLIAEGNEIVMECKTKSNPTVREYWWFYSEKMIKSDAYKGVHVKNDSLIIKKASRQHNGKYYCIANNVVGRGKSNELILNVDYAPVCRTAQKMVYGVGVGETAKVLCDVDARPNQVHFQWSFNNTHNSDLLFISEGLRSSLSFTPQNKHQYGYVSCWANNAVGTQQVPCIYNIIPAGKPESVIECKAVNNHFTSFVINCIPGYDGGLEQSFSLELFDSKTQNSVRNVTNSKESSFVLNDLQPANKYSIKVYALNVKGKSEPFYLTSNTLMPTINPEEAQEISDGSALLYSVAIISATVLMLLLLIILICKIKQKCQQNSFDRYEQKRSSERADDIIEYYGSDGTAAPQSKNINSPDVIPPEQYLQSNGTSTSKCFFDDTLSRRMLLETRLCDQCDCDSRENVRNNFYCLNNDISNRKRLDDQCVNSFEFNDRIQRWPQSESPELFNKKLNHTSDYISCDMNAYPISNFCARKSCKMRYTSTPV